MKFKKFTQFINEEQTDIKLVKKMEEYAASKGEGCPRCGKLAGECICMERDYGSTLNLHRLGKGKVNKKESQFKKE